MWTWKCCRASVAGFSHLESGLPCQDANQVLIEGDRVIAIVSDGAGSAKHSDQGSRLLCDELTLWLREQLLSENAIAVSLLEDEQIKTLIERALEFVRERVTALALATGSAIEDYHATLIGVIADATGGAFFHIGDGAGFAATLGNPRFISLSAAENGEYANETFFFTQNSWREHLRIKRFGREFEFIALMSDGLTSFALDKTGQEPFDLFFSPLHRFFCENTEESGTEGLVELLQRDDLRKITGDDKTLVWLKRISSDVCSC